MATGHNSLRGADVLVRLLAGQGVQRIFGVPGESYLPVLDALLDVPQIDFITARHEAGAVLMAEAHAKLTGRPGICFVTRGPGAMHASIGVHVAQQDQTPLILFVGQVSRGFRGREAFQEVDHARHFADMAKWSAEIDDPARIPEMLGRALRTALSGRPGPVVLALPEDVLDAIVEMPDAALALPLIHAPQPAPSASELAEFRARLAAARRPFVIAGGGGWTPQAVADLRRWVQRDGLLVACEFRRQDLFDNTDPQYAGDIGFGLGAQTADAIRTSDCLVMLGARLGEVPSGGYTLLNIPVPAQAVVHIHPAPEELGRVYQPDLAINATPQGVLGALLAAPARPAQPEDGDWISQCRSAFDLTVARVPPAPGAVDPAEVLRAAQDILPPGTVITNGAGNYATWVHKIWCYRTFRSQLAPIAGTMGYGLPAAIAAAFEHPDRPVLAVAGDGCFMMSSQELSVAVQHRLPVIVLVMNNGILGTIRMHQERRFPGRISATDLSNPDFVALARSHGAWAARVERTQDFPQTLRAAVAAGGPALIDLALDPEALSLYRSLSEIRAGG